MSRKEWIKEWGVYVFLIVLMVCAVGYVIWDAGQDQIRENYTQNEIKKIETLGFEIKEVVINSPTIYIKYETIQEFLDAAIENNQTTLYREYHTLYFFNEDFSVGHRKWVGYDMIKEYWENLQD